MGSIIDSIGRINDSKTLPWMPFICILRHYVIKDDKFTQDELQCLRTNIIRTYLSTLHILLNKYSQSDC